MPQSQFFNQEMPLFLVTQLKAFSFNVGESLEKYILKYVEKKSTKIG